MSSELLTDCRCICHFYPEKYECNCCEWGNEKWLKITYE